ncbi:MAG: tRNA-dihydrouridine synthase, partial [Erysipelotrichaceae bacterium]
MDRLTVNLSGLILDNPIIPASGTFGYGQEYKDFYDLNILGSISIKGTTLNSRFGNSTPRIAECPSGMINAVGLQNPGLTKVINEELVNLAKIYHKPIIANISGFSKQEYIECCQKIDNVENVGIIELNVSCPNIKDGGMSFGTDSDILFDLVKAVKQVVTKPLYVKLSPNVSDIISIAKAAESAGADG